MTIAVSPAVVLIAPVMAIAACRWIDSSCVVSFTEPVLFALKSCLFGGLYQMSAA